MAICVECGEDFPDKRVELGYATCLSCGDKEASQEIEKRKKLIIPTHHKGGLTYAGSDPKKAKQALQMQSGKTPRDDYARPTNFHISKEVSKDWTAARMVEKYLVESDFPRKGSSRTSISNDKKIIDFKRIDGEIVLILEKKS